MYGKAYLISFSEFHLQFYVCTFQDSVSFQLCNVTLRNSDPFVHIKNDSERCLRPASADIVLRIRVVAQVACAA